MWWHIHSLTERIKHRKTLRNCNRCGLSFKKHLIECPRCSDIDDDKLQTLLQTRSQNRISMGNTMFIIAVALIILMLIFNSMAS